MQSVAFKNQEYGLTIKMQFCDIDNAPATVTDRPVEPENSEGRTSLTNQPPHSVPVIDKASLPPAEIINEIQKTPVKSTHSLSTKI